MNKKIGAAVFAVLFALAAAWYFWPRTETVPVPPPQAAAPVAAVTTPPAPPPEPVAVAKPAIRYPLGESTSSSPLPLLGQSDASFFQALGNWLGNRLVVLFFGDEVIRRIVMTVDNLPRKQLPPDAMPLKPVPGNFATAGQGDDLVMSRRNAARYAAYARIVRLVDADRLTAIYVDFYPLFQRAYEDLSGGDAYFNDRLVEAMDDMLAAPEPAGPVRLVRVGGFHAFADAELEACSAGQKILIRTGPAHAATIKAKLREIRERLTRQAGASGGEAAGNAGNSADADAALK